MRVTFREAYINPIILLREVHPFLFLSTVLKVQRGTPSCVKGEEQNNHDKSTSRTLLEFPFFNYLELPLKCNATVYCSWQRETTFSMSWAWLPRGLRHVQSSSDVLLQFLWTLIIFKIKTHTSNLTDTLLCQHINNRFTCALGSIICRRCYIRCLLFYGLTASADVTLGERHTQQFPGKWLHLSSAIRWCKNYSRLL